MLLLLMSLRPIGILGLLDHRYGDRLPAGCWGSGLIIIMVTVGPGGLLRAVGDNGDLIRLGITLPQAIGVRARDFSVGRLIADLLDPCPGNGGVSM